MGTRVVLNVDIKGKKGEQTLARLTKAVKGLDKSRAITQKGFGGFGTVLGGVLGANLVLGAVTRLTSGITDLGRSVFEAASIAENTAQRFEILTGSVAAANEIVRELTEFAAETPFELKGITDAAAQLISFGFETGEVTERLREIGDVAAGSNSALGEVALIFGQVAAAGKLTGERLLQFQERAIPIGPAIAKTMGIAETAVREAVSAGKVDLETFQKAFASLSGEQGIFFEATIKQSKTLGGVLSTLSDNFKILLGAIGKEFLPIFKEAALAINQFIEDNKDLIVAFSVEPVLAFAKAVKLGFELFKENIPIIKQTADALLNLTVVYGIYKTGVIAADIAQKIWSANLVIAKFVSVAFSSQIAIMTTLQVAFEIATLAAGKALKVFTRAIALTGVGALVIGLGLLGEAFFKARRLNISFTEAIKDTAGAVIQFFLPAIKALLSGVALVAGVFDKELKESIKGSITSLENLSKGLRTAGDASRKRAADAAAASKMDADAAKKNDREVVESRRQRNEELRSEEEIASEARTAKALETIANQKERELEQLALAKELEREFLETLAAEEFEDEEQRQELLRANRESRATAEQKEIIKQLTLKQKVKDELAKEELKKEEASQKRFIKQKQQLGITLATLDRIINDERVKAADEVAGELVALQRSNNNTLKSIGKAAAITQIGISTFESASVLSAKVIKAVPFPINVPLAATLAAARIAFGAEQIGNVLRANEGGTVPMAGGIPGRDSVSASLTPGEFITPAKSADETIDAVIRQRGFIPRDEAEEIIEAREEVSVTINIQGNVIADNEEQVNDLIEKIRDQLEFRNATLEPISS